MLRLITPKEAHTIMNYNLSQNQEKEEKKTPIFVSLKKMISLIGKERRNFIIAFGAIVVNAILNLLGPFLVGHTIDTYIQTKQYNGVLLFSGIILGLYIIAFFVNYSQMLLMGGIGQRMLYSLRNALFNKLQELPVDFFNQNKVGDLISRINNDTDKVNQFFSQSLMQFLGSIITMIGAGIFLLSINLWVGLAALSPAIIVWIITKILSPWVKKRNAESMKSTGNLSAEIQESLANFKVIIAFDRRDYFRKRFETANKQNYTNSIKAGVATNIFMPIYTLAANIGQLIVISFGIFLIIKGYFTIGLLISFIAYVTNFYNPLRQLAALWANFQVAMAGWDRISHILSLESNLKVIEDIKCEESTAYLSFRNVSFKYPNGKEVLHKVSFDLEKGKTYAFVGPTGGGKTTTASLIARLYDANKGTILLENKDIRSYDHEERSKKIGFILQEPILFSGTVRDNILYGNSEYKDFSNDKLSQIITEAGLDNLLNRFDKGLETPIQSTGDGISLGQKQLIAFMRAVLRKPELLILDEATANIDTLTEQLLEEVLQKLAKLTTLVIIAHRLNTIENADEIFFVNTKQIIRAGSLNDAINLLLHDKNES